MRVALISLYNREFAFGLRYLSAVLRRAGHDPQLIFFRQMSRHPQPQRLLQIFSNANFAAPAPEEDKRLLLQRLKDLAPQLVGLSVPSSFFSLAAELSRRIRGELGVPIAWGGIHPTLRPLECLAQADYVGQGEAEISFLELVESLEQGARRTRHPGFMSRDERGRPVDGGPGRYVADLDSLPFPDYEEGLGNKHYIFDGFAGDRPPPQAEHPDYTYNLMTSRGCPFACSYCCNSVLRRKLAACGPWLRRRSPESVIEELRLRSASADVELIHFWDDVFTFDRAWSERFAALYRRHIGLPITAYVHPQSSDPQILRALRRAGLWTANVGLQSGSAKTLRRDYGRAHGAQSLQRTASTLRELGICPHYDLILDNPFEGEDDHRATFELLLALPRPFKLNTFSMCYFPETPFTEKALRAGKISPAAVEGADGKALREFVAVSRPRPAWRLFWNTLISLTQHEEIPLPLLRRLARSRLLRLFPRLLLWPAQGWLAWRRWRHPQRRALAGFFPSRKEGEPADGGLRLLAAEARQGEGLALALAVDASRLRSAPKTLSLDAYPLYEGRHPERHLGYWNLSWDGAAKRIDVRLRWPQASFTVDGVATAPADQWLGTGSEEELYKVEVLLYGEGGTIVSRLPLRVDGEVILRGGGGRVVPYAIGL